MAEQNERTFQMKQSYVELHNQGLSVREIAKRFNLTPRAVYTCLNDIALQAGVPRESLLDRSHKQHKKPCISRTDQSGIILADHETYAKETLTAFDRVITSIRKYCNLQEEIIAEEEEETHHGR